MSKRFRFAGIFLAIVILMSQMVLATALAAGETIDVSTASQGYFTVSYSDGSNAKMKVRVICAGSTTYSDYVQGRTSSYSFSRGDGQYTITLYKNTTGTSYKTVTKKSVYVTLGDEYSQYLVSTSEITFSVTDSVGLKAAELVAGKTSDEEKVVAIYNYIAGNFTYDNSFAQRILNGEVTVYVPNTADILEAKTGVCYDFSALFAAMCRSQGIPCVITKGYYSGVRHAWNKVCVNEEWYAIDLTYSISARVKNVSSLAACITPVTSYSGSSDTIPLSDIVPASEQTAQPVRSTIQPVQPAPMTRSANRFTDVASSAWYAQYVARAYELGLINGTSATTFAPGAQMRLCEAIKLAACLHSQYCGDGETFAATGSAWYTVYVYYAIENGILTSEYSDYSAYLTRAQFAQIFANALPNEALVAINSVTDGAIPDVGMAASYAPAVYKLYRAGITVGASEGYFNPESGITRAEVSAIVVRMADSGYRVSVTLG